MKAKIKVEATVDVGRKDYKALEAAGPLELVQTAQMQGAKISTSVEKARQTAKERKAEPPEPGGEEGSGDNVGKGGGVPS